MCKFLCFLPDFVNTHASSSAIAKRPCDASCLSVVSSNSAVRRAESFIVSYIGYIFITACKCCSVVFGVTLRLLDINISSSSPAIIKLRRLLPAVSVTAFHGPAAPSRSQRSQHAMELIVEILARDIGSESRFLPFLLHSTKNIATRWLKNLEDIFVRFDRIHKRDRQTTDRQTDTCDNFDESGVH